MVCSISRIGTTAVSIPLLLATFLVACAGSGQFRRPEPVPDDRQDILAPKFREKDVFAMYFDKQITDQGEQVFDLSRQFRRLFGRPKQAFNVDAFDEVPNSSWFTNRNHRLQLPLEAIAQGPGEGRGPDSNGIWEVVSAKVGGATAGFQIVDSRGDRYVLKFDPPGYPEMATGAEVVATNLIYAAGYNTPENQLTHFRPEQLRLDDNVAFIDLFGRERFMTQTDLDAVLARVHRLPDGRIRTMASRFLSGKILGPFEYDGTRPDDPNDFIPHQHRRELRGLRYIAAWINHYDTKSANSMDVYVEAGGHRYVRHYLMDFGSTLGSQGNEPMPIKVGYENTKDPRQTLINTVTLGLYVPPWQRETEIRYPAVGRFSSRLFNPPKYKPITPNPAFENLTNRDGYWGAKIVMSFTDEQIEAAVAAGQYTDPEAAAYLLQTLIERRDKIGRYWFAKMNPLDRFELHRATGATSEVCFADLAVDSGLEQAASTHYRYWVEFGDQEAVTAKETQSPCVQLSSLPASLSSDGANSSITRITLQTRRETTKSWSKRVWVFLGTDEAGALQLLGLQREE